MSAPVTLEARLDLTQAAPLRDALLARRGAPVTLDAGPVRQISTPTAQVLLSAARTWTEDGQTLVIENLDAGVIEQLSILGLSPLDLGAPEGGAMA